VRQENIVYVGSVVTAGAWLVVADVDVADGKSGETVEVDGDVVPLVWLQVAALAGWIERIAELVLDAQIAQCGATMRREPLFDCRRCAVRREFVRPGVSLREARLIAIDCDDSVPRPISTVKSTT
jgi:hypothetical protein